MPEKLVRPEPLEPHPPHTRMWRAVERGATWGTLAGLIVAQIYIRANSIDTPFGPIYGGNMFLAFAIPSGIGAALGAALGWLSVQQTSDERALNGEPDPDDDDEPIELGSDELAPAGTAGIFFTENGRAIFLTGDGSCYVDFGTSVKKFSTALAFRRAYADQAAWTEVTDPKQIEAYKAIIFKS